MSRFSFSSRVRAHKDVSDSEDDIASSASSSSSDNSGLKSENAGHRIGDENEEVGVYPRHRYVRISVRINHPIGDFR